MPTVIHEGKRIEYVKFNTTLPVDMSKVLDQMRSVPGHPDLKAPRAHCLQHAFEFYCAMTGRLPKGYAPMTDGVMEAERVKDRLMDRKAGKK